MKNNVAGWILCAACGMAVVSGCQQSPPPPNAVQVATNHYVEGQLAMDRNDYEAALAELHKAIQVDPSLSAAHAAIGDVYRKQGNFKEAASAYEQAVSTDPFAFRPQYNLGVVYQVLADAADNAKVAAEYVQKAISTYLKALEIQPADFDANLNLSACYFQEGKYELAEQYCKAAVAADPKNPSGYFNLGMIYKAQNQSYDAIRAFKDSLELDIQQPKLLLELGNVYMKLSRLKDAQKAFELSTQQDPNNSEAWQQIGQVYYHQKRYDDAVGAYEKAIQITPKSPMAYRGLGVVYMTQYLSQMENAPLRDKALEAWNASLELNSGQGDLVKLVAKYTPALSKPAL